MGIMSSDHFKKFDILPRIFCLSVALLLRIRIIIRSQINDNQIRHKPVEIPAYSLRLQRIVKLPFRFAHLVVVVWNKMRGEFLIVLRIA
ncbi:hypothetical protein D3C80_1536440 [compost metagenome]